VQSQPIGSRIVKDHLKYLDADILLTSYCQQADTLLTYSIIGYGIQLDCD